MMTLSQLHRILILLIWKLCALFNMTDSRNAGFLFNDFAWQPYVFSPPLSTVHWTEDLTIEPLIMHRLHPQNTAFVYKIKFCKRRMLPEHEFLVCYLKEASEPISPAGGFQRKSVVLIERNEARLTSTTRSFDRWRVRGIDDIMMLSRTGNDAFVRQFEKKYDTCAMLHLKTQSFTLYQLITLFTTIHQMENVDTAGGHHRYWLAFAVYDSIRKMFPLESDEEKFQRVLLPPGKLLGMFSSGKGRYSTEQYIERYSIEWEVAKTKIMNARVQAERGKVQEVREQRIEAEARAQKAKEERIEAEAKLEKLEKRLEALSSKSRSQPST